MTIGQFIETEAYSSISNPITYLIFGGQGSVYVSKLEYCPAKKQVKLLSEPKETYQGPVTVENLMTLPGDTEILIEGYPGDDTTPLQWETPDNVEFLNDTIDFQRLLSDEEHKILFDAREELYGIMENLRNQDIPDEEIKKIFTTIYNMRITREDYQVYLKYIRKYNIVEGPTAIFIDKNKEDIEKAFKGTNIKAIEL